MLSHQRSSLLNSKSTSFPIELASAFELKALNLGYYSSSHVTALFLNCGCFKVGALTHRQDVVWDTNRKVPNACLIGQFEEYLLKRVAACLLYTRRLRSNC